VTALTVFYLACFQAAAVPSLVRIVRRRSSADLSVWREWLILAGVVAQFVVMRASGVESWHVLASPVASGCGLVALLVAIYRYR
jgi:hypothetical protein